MIFLHTKWRLQKAAKQFLFTQKEIFWGKKNRFAEWEYVKMCEVNTEE